MWKLLVNCLSSIKDSTKRPPHEDLLRGVRFTPRAQQVFSLAYTQCKRHGKKATDAEHLMLGLLEMREGVAANVLQTMGVDLVRVHQLVEHEAVLRSKEMQTGDVRFTGTAKKILLVGNKEQKMLGHVYFGTEHILLGLLHESPAASGHLFKKESGMDLKKVRQKILKELDPNFVSE